MSLGLLKYKCIWLLSGPLRPLNGQTDICESPSRPPCPALYTRIWSGASGVVIKGFFVNSEGG